MSASRFTVDPATRLMLRDLGISQRAVLRRAGLPADLFAHETVGLRPEEYYRLWSAIEAESPIPDLAVLIAQAITVEMFTPPLFAALCSPDLATATERIATYKPLIGPMTIDIGTTTSAATITMRWPAGGDPPATLVHIELLFWAALARIATRHHVLATAATSPFPQDSPAAAEYLGCAITSGPDPSISFDQVDARRPFLTENETMWRFFAPELRRRLADLDASSTTAERVRAALLETLPAGESSIGAITRHLAVSGRTLQRQLQREGTSYQAVLAATRKDLAEHYLANSTTSPAEIAYLIGYEDSNSFYRAFRTWTDTTPDAFRAVARAG